MQPIDLPHVIDIAVTSLLTFLVGRFSPRKKVKRLRRGGDPK